jgi:hypothetical protein
MNDFFCMQKVTSGPKERQSEYLASDRALEWSMRYFDNGCAAVVAVFANPGVVHIA